VSSAVTDTVTDNDSDVASVDLERHADIAVALAGPSEALVGETLVLTASVTNEGPSTAIGDLSAISPGGGVVAASGIGPPNADVEITLDDER